MTKTSVGGGQHSTVPGSTVCDSQTGRVLPLKGYGALKGRYAVRAGIDLTKPIAEQAASLDHGDEPDRAAGDGTAPER